MNIKLTNIDSKLITEVEYNQEKEMMIVEYLGYSSYEYKDVPESIFFELMNSESKGKFMNSIKGDYEFIKKDEGKN